MSQQEQETNGNLNRKPALHRALCSICKHPRLKEIEARYLQLVSERRIAAEFDVSDDAVHNHVDYFGLNLERGANTEKILETIISKGFGQLSKQGVKIGDKLLIEAIKEYDKITGKQKEAAKNPQDLAKDYLNWLMNEYPNIDEAELREKFVKPKYGDVELGTIG
jgi:hypothetical protein